VCTGKWLLGYGGGGHDEIELKRRGNSLSRLTHVRQLIMESDGEISVIKKDQK